MSVVVEGPDKVIKLLMKGADSSLLSIVGEGGDEYSIGGSESVDELQPSDGVMSATLKHLDNYARKGLRTLVVASKVLTRKEVKPYQPVICEFHVDKV